MGTHSAASLVRRSATAVVEAFLIVAIIISLAVAWSAATGRPVAVPGVGAASTTSWIALRQTGLTASAQPTLGSIVWFDTAYPKTVKNPRIEVLCSQSGALVYGEAGSVTDGFLLGGSSSDWLTSGGAASCTANLYYFGSHAGKQTYNRLASTSFDAGG